MFMFLAAMSSSRSDDDEVTRFVCMFVRSSQFFNLEVFEANFDVLMFLVFHQCFTRVSPVFTSLIPAPGTTAQGDKCTSSLKVSYFNVV